MSVMYDSVDVAGYPAGTTLALGYVDGNWPDAAAVQARFPSATVVTVTTTVPGDLSAQVFDCEKGDGQAVQAAQWASNKITGKRGRPTIYCSRIGAPGYGWDDCRTELMTLGVHPMDVDFGIADYTGQRHILAGSVFTQWASPGNGSPGNYDISETDGTWPALPPVPAKGDDMIEMTCTGKGYWVLRPDGSVWAYGDASYHGGLNWVPPAGTNVLLPEDSATGFSPTPSQQGYVITTAKGFTYAFGDATYLGSPGF